MTFESGTIARIITVTPIVCLVSTIAIANFELHVLREGLVSYVHETPNIMGLSYLLSIMGLVLNLAILADSVGSIIYSSMCISHIA